MTVGVRVVMIKDRCGWTCGSEVSDASRAPGSTRFRAQRALTPYTVSSFYAHISPGQSPFLSSLIGLTEALLVGRNNISSRIGGSARLSSPGGCSS